MSDAVPYTPRRSASSRFEPLRGLTYHVNSWGDESLASPERPPVVMMHGWMDVGVSFQFVVDELAALDTARGTAPRWVLAPDWRGFGRTPPQPGTDSYWFPDYVADLDALLRRLWPHGPVDLLGHSMGGNVVMLYAGTRPQRIRRLVNLEGFGMPRTQPEQAPARMAQWLDELAEPARLKPYPDLAAVAARLQANDPRLRADRAMWLAEHWPQPVAAVDGGGWQLQADPAHKHVNPMLYRVDEALATWAAIEAPLLWVEGLQTQTGRWWGDRYSKAEFHQRLDVVRQARRETLDDCGHMLHHDQPAALAALLHDFLR